MVKGSAKMDETQIELHRLQHCDYSGLPILKSTKDVAAIVRNALTFIVSNYNISVNYYSGALKNESLYTFQETVKGIGTLFNVVNYLEIGSALGASVSLVSLLVKEANLLGEVVSIDPYFKDGYVEGANGIWGKNTRIKMDENVLKIAKALYKKLNLDVNIIRKVSSDGLLQLIRNNKKFNLIYIDGSHEKFNPLIDFALCSCLLEDRGIVMLDDHYWPDVNIVKKLCDKYLIKIHECWKIAVYQWS